MLYSQTKNLSILLVEDYEPLRHDLFEFLNDLYKTVGIAKDGNEGLKVYQEYFETEKMYFDIILTDIQMPVMNGVELSKQVRNINTDQQIIVLSGHTDSTYLIDLINLGVAQFITKPIENDELINTLYNVSKNLNHITIEPDNTTIIKLNENYSWDNEIHVLKQDDQIIDLTRHELFLLQFLIMKKTQLCGNEEIIKYFYDNGIDISEKNIRNLVFKLRKKLPTSTIKSMYGLGYKLMSVELMK